MIQKLNRKGEGGSILTNPLIITILVILVVIIAVGISLKVDPRDVIKSIFPSYNYTKENPYKGFCMVYNPDFSVIDETGRPDSKGNFLSFSIYGTPECYNLPVEVWLFKNSQTTPYLKFQSAFNIINKQGSETWIATRIPDNIQASLEPENEYAFSLRYEGKKLLLKDGDGKLFDASNQIEVEKCKINKAEIIKWTTTNPPSWTLEISTNGWCYGTDVTININGPNGHLSTYPIKLDTVKRSIKLAIFPQLGGENGNYYATITNNKNNDEIFSGKIVELINSEPFYDLRPK